MTINDNYKRTCILVSKLLQNIANGVSFKEQYLQSLNQWASEMNKQILHFVGELLDIPADAATDTNNFAPTTIATSMAHCIADLQKYMCDLREQLCGYYQSNTERFVEGMSFTTSRLLSVILGAGLLAAQSSSEPPFLKSYSKVATFLSQFCFPSLRFETHSPPSLDTVD